MPYVYRYIDMTKQEVCYVGKVTHYKDIGYDPLARRHEQHKREEWYKKIGDRNILFQFIETDSHTDADILETWLINYYCGSGHLINKGKMEWGKSNIDLLPYISGKWVTYYDYGTRKSISEKLMMVANIIVKEDWEAYIENAQREFKEAFDSMFNDKRCKEARHGN